MARGTRTGSRTRPILIGLALATALIAAPESSLGLVYGSLAFDAECQPDGTKLVRAAVMIDEFVGQVEEVRLVRSRIGECGAEEVVDAIDVDPLAAGEYSFELVDSEPAIGVPFKYRVTLHDDQGVDLRVDHFFSIYRFFDLESCGPALIGHGVLRSPEIFAGEGGLRTGSGAPYLEPCADSCWIGLDVAYESDSGVDAHIDTGVPVRLYGEFWVGDIISGASLVISEVQTDPCEGQVPAERRSWGSLKSRY